uniref:Uncharacterized protein n=1 Tax=Electrophorus electricus TaxID=8005 RepID=A0A4W4H972_ELEEL
MKSETTPIGDPCHNLTPTSTAVRTESGFGFAACTQEKAPARNCLPEMSSSSKINDVQASGRYSEIMVDHLTFEMQKEAALSKPVKASKNSLRHRPSHLTTKIFKTGLSNTGEGVYLTRHVPNGNKHKEAPSSDKNLMQNREPMLHFASSDINPFIHTTKADELLRTVPKNQAFGSAVNISRLLSPLESSEKHITRCCSVDNGLNVLNSPFNSHLSSYAIHKGLSSTLSSVEDSKEHSCTESQLKGLCHTSFVFNEKTLADLSSESCNNTSDLGHSSGQVDEIVLVYSSDHETQESGLKGLSKCDHSTSHTQVPVSSQTHGTSTTWASLQNMSAHLSELILNTSDLLGNIQCMRSGERFLLYENPAKNSSYISAVHSDKYCKSDGSTQTVVDIGIQTEDTSMLMKQSKVVNQSPAVENEREARLQTCRRARSLSPSKHPNSSAQRPSHLPSRRREYLQQLRQEVVQTSR